MTTNNEGNKLITEYLILNVIIHWRVFNHPGLILGSDLAMINEADMDMELVIISVYTRLI